MTPLNLDSQRMPANAKPSENCWVFKLGGSLLDLPDLAERLRTVVGQVSQRPLIVVGGGKAADLVREWDEAHSLSASSAHWLAVRAMEFNQHLIETLLPETIPLSHPRQAPEAWKRGEIPLLSAWEWLNSETDEPDMLPHSWDVTSDSIAAWATLHVQAEGLVLLKSLKTPKSYTALSESVDRHCPKLLSQLPRLAWCNLRSDPIRVSSIRFNLTSP